MREPNFNTIRSQDFVADRAWGALDIARMEGVTVRLHWTDAPYRWHINDGQEVFVVLHGTVDMHHKSQDRVMVVRLLAGDIFYAGSGCEHVAHPLGQAHILVVEKMGSI